ncbi:MAG: dihydroorotate dehydrogenase electron transfer subunit [Candidatus Cloacimonetes bacterium]|nr:dihydroorotate dehydrogenase electron transfer subunit [Candidatus Cloacimonadota bacterium]MBS3767914.1 dihydroorotate dehydrogenase electron transfer subunit [Candidatus Cloacimonadota bacterium]
MQFKILPIKENRKLNSRYFVLKVPDKSISAQSQPGQFCEIKDLESDEPLLPRPFSIYKVEENTISFLIKIVGETTRNLSQKKTAEMISILGPLGNGFKIPKNKSVLLISGGIGYAPFPFLKNKLQKNGNEIQWLHGGKDKYDIFSYDITNYTEDGSIGKKGLVTDDMPFILGKNDIHTVFACGPNQMLKKVSEICEFYKVELQVSMETIMACGMGVCCGCIIKYAENGEVIYKKACKDGPVFDGRKVVWDE